MNTPQRSRPQIQADYGIPTTEEGMLDWAFVEDEMTRARNYWIASTRPDGRPHVVPVWGIWLAGVFYHGGGAHTRKARNLAQNPHVAVHLESGDRVVILEGTVAEVTDPALVAQVDACYVAKYGMEHGTPLWQLHPQAAFAWTEYPVTVTRWRW